MLDLILYLLAAAGVLLILWALWGALLVGMSRGGAVVCYCGSLRRAEQLLRWHRWLWGAGLCRMPLLLICHGLDGRELETLDRALGRTDGAELCQEELLTKRLKMEEESNGSGGAGAAAGDCGGGGVPKL